MDILDIQNAVVPVTVEWGVTADGKPIVTILKARPEKISFEDNEYTKLLQQEHELRSDLFVLTGKLISIRNDNAIAEKLNKPVEEPAKSKAKPTLRMPTEDERDERLKAILEEMQSINAESTAKERAIAENHIARIAFLAPEWDVTHKVDGVDVMLPVTVENLKRFSQPRLDLMFDAVEASVRGPLPAGTNSGS